MSDEMKIGKVEFHPGEGVSLPQGIMVPPNPFAPSAPTIAEAMLRMAKALEALVEMQRGPLAPRPPVEIVEALRALVGAPDKGGLEALMKDDAKLGYPSLGKPQTVIRRWMVLRSHDIARAWDVLEAYDALGKGDRA